MWKVGKSSPRWIIYSWLCRSLLLCSSSQIHWSNHYGNTHLHAHPHVYLSVAPRWAHRLMSDSPLLIGWLCVRWWLYGISHGLFIYCLCGFGCIRWLTFCRRVLVFVWTQIVAARRNVTSVKSAIVSPVRFQLGSLKPTKMWLRWASSRPRCASSRRGSRCPSSESLISSQSKPMRLYTCFYKSPTP